MTSGPMKIAVVGAGIAGNVAAYRLGRTHDVTVFEAGGYVGGHTNTIRVDLADETQFVDTGFIVFNEPNYPHFVALLKELGVAWQPTSMSFSVRCDQTGLEYNGTSLNGLLAQRGNLLRPRFWRMLRDIVRFGREAPALLACHDAGPSVSEYVAGHRYSRPFVEHYLVPLGTALWSSPAATFRAFPMKFVVQFLQNHRMLQIGGRPDWQVVKGGSCRYVEKLVAAFRGDIRLNTPVVAIRRSEFGVQIQPRDGEAEWFDHVVIACHADQALRLVEDPTPTERDLLSAFPYQHNEAVLHTDTSVLPRSRRAWASWNAHVPREDRDRVAVTYNMNMLQGLNSRHTFCVTLNDDAGIDEAKIIRRIRYHHPVYTRRQEEAQSRHSELVNANHTSFCGAYWGFGFHEDGVRSALRVCDALTSRAAVREVAHA